MDENLWAKIEFHLSEIRDVLRMRIEPQDNAIGRQIEPGNPGTGKKARWRDTSPRWDTENSGGAVRPWLLIPYVDAIDQEMLQDHMALVKRLINPVEQQVVSRSLTPKFLHDWGLLCQSAGALQLVYNARPDVGQLRRGAKNLDKHKRWFAEYFLREYKHGNRAKVLSMMEQLINSIIASLPHGFEKEWFERFFSPNSKPPHRTLSDEFTQHLSAAKMRQLVKQPMPNDLPSLHMEFPRP